MTTRLVGVGAGGHARSVLDAALLVPGWVVVGMVDPDPALHGRTLDGVPVLGGDEELAGLLAAGTRAAFVGLGGTGDNRPRRALWHRLLDLGFELPPVLHPAAVVSASARVGSGSVLLARAVLNAGAVAGADVILNTAAVVDHGCRLGDHVHIGPGAVLAADVEVGELAHVGVGASVRQGVRIGAGAIVGAGAAVVSDVAAGTVVTGVPARPRG